MDEVALGTIEDYGLLTPNLTFGVAKIIDRDTQADVIDGIMGLGFPQKFGPESLINRAIREKKLENPIYTIFLDKIGGDEHKPGGEIYFGGFDTTYCTKNITYVPLTTTNYWQFKADKIVVAGKVGENEMLLMCSIQELYRNLQVVSDTGTSSLVMPRADFKQVMKAIGLPAKSRGLPYVPCKLKFILEIWINNVQHTLTAQELMVRYSDGCVLEIDITEWQDDKTWVLGDPFCRSYCTVHDLGKRRIGFARAKMPKNWSRNRVSICGKKCQNAGRTQEQWFASRLRPPLDDSADTTPIPVYDSIEEEYLEE
ncbi:Peptidase A1 domain-containing protein [Aphelenchoides besseyi]|nr:Peptidase A1 domain-containing protein [Aphelenchoides besseyi]KAI6209219.1 Peptidase A1 domain-containing protein [Aphelenchoides besseyi]